MRESIINHLIILLLLVILFCRDQREMMVDQVQLDVAVLRLDRQPHTEGRVLPLQGFIWGNFFVGNVHICIAKCTHPRVPQACICVHIVPFINV